VASCGLLDIIFGCFTSIRLWTILSRQVREVTAAKTASTVGSICLTSRQQRRETREGLLIEGKVFDKVLVSSSVYMRGAILQLHLHPLRILL